MSTQQQPADIPASADSRQQPAAKPQPGTVEWFDAEVGAYRAAIAKLERERRTARNKLKREGSLVKVVVHDSNGKPTVKTAINIHHKLWAQAARTIALYKKRIDELSRERAALIAKLAPAEQDPLAKFMARTKRAPGGQQ